MDRIEEVNQSLTELWDAATALYEPIEQAKSTNPVERAESIIKAIEARKPVIEAIEARWGKDVWWKGGPKPSVFFEVGDQVRCLGWSVQVLHWRC
jgi:hypothetical protein